MATVKVVLLRERLGHAREIFILRTGEEFAFAPITRNVKRVLVTDEDHAIGRQLLSFHKVGAWLFSAVIPDKLRRREFTALWKLVSNDGPFRRRFFGHSLLL